MKRAMLLIALFCAAALAGHVFVLNAVPRIIMNKAMTKMQARGVPVHGFALSARTTPETQTVVRPSPDLAYSICLYDLKAGGPLTIYAAPYDGYASVSFFDARTNNFASVRVGAGDEAAGAKLTLHRKAQDLIKSPGRQIISPSRKGIILIRRLAPTQAEYDKVVEISKNDRCEPAKD